MDTNQLAAFLDSLEALRAAGREEEAKELLMSRMQELPEEIQGEIIVASFTGALEKETAAMQVIRNIQERGLEAARALQKEADKVDK